MGKNSFDRWVSKLTNFDFLYKYSDRVTELNGIQVEFTSLPYRIIKNEVPALIEKGQFHKAIWKILGEEPKGDKYDRLKYLFWILDQYKLINELEQTYLSSPPDPKLIAAGIKELDVLGDINIIDSLAGGDVLKWEAVRDLPYSTIFDKQLKNTIENRISKKMEANSRKK